PYCRPRSDRRGDKHARLPEHRSLQAQYPVGGTRALLGTGVGTPRQRVRCSGRSYGAPGSVRGQTAVCGIWFSLGFPPDPACIGAVAHRGPDGNGWKVFESTAGPLALGHRRLSIIDLSDAALQPMSYANDRFWVVYNGEIYNYLELREELHAAGHRFRTRSDTEVLLAAY